MTAALDVLRSLRLEDGRSWGEAAAGFQLEDAEQVLTGPVPYSFLTRARGGSKTVDLAAVTIAAMLTQLPPRSRVYGLAADLDQGGLLVDAVAGFAARTPELRNALRVDRYRATATRSGSVLDVLAADAPGAWGLRPAMLIVDELAQWASTPGPRRLWEAASSAVAKSRDARLVVLTTAGAPEHWSRKVLDHAKADPLWRVHEVPGPPPWLDAGRLAEQRRRLPESSYARLFLNRWTAAEDRLTTVDDLAACTTLDGPVPPEIGRRYLIGLDVGVVHDRTVAAVCHVERTDEEGRRVVLDRLQAWAGTRAKPVQLQEVAEWVALVSAEYKQATVIYDPHQAVLLAQQLARRGVHVRRFDFTSTSVGRLALSLYRALRERQLALPDDPELLDELANVRIVERSPGQYRIDHDPDRHDDRAIALALCVHDLLDRRRPSSDGWSLLDERRGLRDLADPMRQILRLREHSGTVKYNQSF